MALQALNPSNPVQDPTQAFLGSLLPTFRAGAEIKNTITQAAQNPQAQKQKALLAPASQAFSSLRSGNPEAAATVMDRQAIARRNSGDEQGAVMLEALSKLTREKPAEALEQLSAMMTRIPGGTEVMENSAKLNKELRDERAAGEKVTLDNAELGIKKENARIAAMQAQLARETNELKKQDLQIKIAEAETKRADTQKAKAAQLASSEATTQNLSETIDRILGQSVIRNKEGKTVGYSGALKSAAGPTASRLPTFSQNVADLEEEVKTLTSQVTLAKISELKGMGALSDKESDLLGSSLQSLSLRQSPEKFVANLERVKSLIQKAQLATRTRLIDDEKPPTMTAGAGPAAVSPTSPAPNGAVAAAMSPDKAKELSALEAELARRNAVVKR